MPAARALSSPSGEAAEDNVVEREKFWVGRNYGLGYGLRIPDSGDGQTDVKFEIVIQMYVSIQLLKIPHKLLMC